jgi:hypothetical protein
MTLQHHSGGTLVNVKELEPEWRVTHRGRELGAKQAAQIRFEHLRQAG